ncbi:MAG: hypothetical protein WBO10_07200 [Pyrinomonadaceae bacterium]
MNNLFSQVLSYALIPASAVLIVGFIAEFWKPGATVHSLVQHFAGNQKLGVSACPRLRFFFRQAR